MKRKIFTFLLVLGVAWSLHSCDNNDDESIAAVSYTHLDVYKRQDIGIYNQTE